MVNISANGRVYHAANERELAEICAELGGLSQSQDRALQGHPTPLRSIGRAVGLVLSAAFLLIAFALLWTLAVLAG